MSKLDPTKSTHHFVRADRLFSGRSETPLLNQIVEIRNGKIASVAPASSYSVDPGVWCHNIVAPGFIDLQINGAGGVLFNDTPDADTLSLMADAAQKGGTCHLLPTFITAPDSDYFRAMEAVEAVSANPAILGLHLEGPFLSPEKPGIHPAKHIRSMTAADLERLSSFPERLLLTVAPECLDKGQMETLCEADAMVFAGHTNASFEQIIQASDKGLKGITHLFNACTQLLSRAPGVVGAAFADDRLFAGIIADRHHVHAQNLRLASQVMRSRLFLVSDTMPTFGGNVCRFTLLGMEVNLVDDRLQSRDGTLAGAHLGLDEAVRRMVQTIGLEPQEALRMASHVPARAIGVDHLYGEIAVGRSASLTCLDEDFRTQAVLVHGARRTVM